MPKSKVLENRVVEINNFKNYYEYLISLSDPDYANSFTLAFQQNKTEAFDETSGAAFSSRPAASISVANENIQNKKTSFWASIKLSNILINLYFLGILFFAGRLLLLFRWINQTLKKYGSSIKNNVLLVKMDEEVPPFSFFRFVFLNKETHLHPGFEQIVTHEKVHINQQHSIDLLLAHSITVFQWFNPFAWLINKAMKTNHEYIADRSVVEQGYELFDYQSLMLEQIISIRSVELVNNFNLINIKKRIAMMTKIKSGIASQLKALVVIPAAIFMFFFFAEITFAQEKHVSVKTIDITNELQGFWKNEDANDYGKLLNFKDTELQILESTENYRLINFKSQTGSFGSTREYYNSNKFFKHVNSSEPITTLMTLPLEPGKSKMVLLSLQKDKLIVGWTPEQVSIYKRMKISNSSEQFYSEFADNFAPVSTSFYRTIENSDKTFRVLMNRKGDMMLNNKRLDVSEIAEKIQEVKRSGNPFDSDEKIPIVIIDRDCEMAYVNLLFRKLQEMNELRYVISVRPNGKEVPEIFYHNIGIPRLLPPKDTELFDKDEVEKNGIKIHKVDLNNQNVTPESVAKQLKDDIREGQKYVMLYMYNHSTKYGEYMDVLDAIYTTIHTKRDTLAQEKYKLDFDELAIAQQKEVRKVYPMALTEKNVDYNE